MAAGDKPTSWRDLCRAAAQEQDPRKLLELLRQINQALVEQRLATPESQSCA